MSRAIILASTSRYRRAILDAIGLDYQAHAPDFEEVPDDTIAPEAMAISFARAKAESLGERYPEALILGSDQVVELDGRALGKPGTPERAVEQLLRLAGRTHRLLTAVALHDASAGRTEHRLVVHQMRMRPLTEALAGAYIARDQPLDCAGAYKVESLGAALFEEMLGTDHTAIVGLPITGVAELLAGAGVDLLARISGAWTRPAPGANPLGC